MADVATLAARLFAEARTTHPDLAVDEPAFAAAVAERAARCKGDERLRGADLYLACAAERGDAAAVARLDALLADATSRALRADASGALGDDVRQYLREKLLLPRAGGRPGIAAYSGVGPLAAWLRASAVRAASRLREGAADDPTRRRALQDLPFEQLVEQSADPEIGLLRATYTREFREALHEAVDKLEPRQRNLLRLHVGEGLTGAQIAAAYGVSAPTSSRWLAEARVALREHTRALLTGRLSLSSSQIDSLSALVLSRLEASLPRVLDGG